MLSGSQSDLLSMATSLGGGRGALWLGTWLLAYLPGDSSVRKASEVILISMSCKEDNVYLQKKFSIDINLKHSNPRQPCIRSYQRN